MSAIVSKMTCRALLCGLILSSGLVWGVESLTSAPQREQGRNFGKDLTPIPVRADFVGRTPGFRVDTSPFRPPDPSEIWAMRCGGQSRRCEGKFVKLFLDAGSGELFALMHPDTVLPDQTVCCAYGRNNRRYWVLYHRDRNEFLLQATPEKSPI